MNQRAFVARYEGEWQAFERTVERLGALRGSSRPGPDEVEEFPFRYRRLCQQLALARDRDYSTGLVDRLNALVLRGHRHLYRARAGAWSRVARFVAGGFAARVRAEARVVWVALALLFVPAAGAFVAIDLHPDLAYRIVDAARLVRLEHMYDPASPHFARERPSDGDFLMFGYYVRHNVGIGFQTFAGGMLLGLGSVFYLVFNGLQLGVIGAHLANVGFATTFTSFVITHAAFELTAIALAGAAGLELGLALLAPRRRTRLDALRRAARASLGLVYGAVAMLVLAAFVEAYWSSSTTVPVLAKYVVGGACWLAVAVYFLRAGRDHGSR